MAEVEVPKQHKACVYNDPGNVSVKVEMVRNLVSSMNKVNLTDIRLILLSQDQVTDRVAIDRGA